MNKFTLYDIEQFLIEKYDGHFIVNGDYENIKSKLDFTCTRCGEVYIKTFDYVKHKGIRCRNCDEYNTTSKPIVGIDDLWTTRPDVASLLLDPEDGFRYKENSGKRTNFKCPCCGNIINSRIYNVSRYRLSCNNCSDGISYANKFMSNLLQQVGVDFIPEYSPDWIYPYRYDFYFSIDNINYIVEMDGGWHYIDNSVAHKTVVKQKEIDSYKDIMAEKHNIIVIRIDCYYKNNDRYTYVKNSILNSDIVNLFNISLVDFDKCAKAAERSKFWDVCDMWNQGMHTYKEIADACHISKNTVKAYLQRSEVLKTTDYSHESFCKESHLNGIKMTLYKRQKPFRCIETGEIFNHVADANKKYHTYVNNYFNGKQKYAEKLEDGTKLHWEHLSDEEKKQYLNFAI